MKKILDITIILDRSASMQSLKQRTIDGFNEFLNTQKHSGIEGIITLVQFDHEYQKVYQSEEIKNAPLLNDNTYEPRGMTALLDAIGKTIKSTKRRHKLEKTKKKKAKTLLVIITDGYENNSVTFTSDKIFKMIKKKEEKRDWEFVYLGTNQDAISEAGKYGIRHSRAMSISEDEEGVTDMYKSLSSNVTACSKSEKHFEFTDEQRENQNSRIRKRKRIKPSTNNKRIDSNA